MARRTTLGTLVTMLRSETFTSVNSAHGVSQESTMKHLLARVQEDLWDEFEWPHLRVFEDKALQAGQRYYDYPTGVRFDRIKAVWVRNGSQWVPLRRGIGPDQYSIYDSDDTAARSDPARNWDFYAGAAADQFEIWPMPATNADATTREGYVRFAAIRELAPLVSESDRADLDDRLIVLGAAVDMLVERESASARSKINTFRERKKRLHGNSKTLRPVTTLGGAGSASPAVHGNHNAGHHWNYTEAGVPYSDFRW